MLDDARVKSDTHETGSPCDDGVLEGDEALQLQFMGVRFRPCDRQMAEERKVFLKQSFSQLKPVWDAIQAEQPISMFEVSIVRDFLSHLDMGLEQGWFTLMDFGISPEDFSFACFTLSFYSRYAERLPVIFLQRFDFTLADWAQSKDVFETLGLDPTQYALSFFLRLKQCEGNIVYVSFVLMVSTPFGVNPAIQKGTFFSNHVPAGTVPQRLGHLADAMFRVEAIRMCAREEKWRVMDGDGETVDA